MRKFIFCVVIVILIAIFGLGCYYAYIDINCSAAKEYLIKNYDLDEKKLKSKSYTEYVYEDIANCSTLWFKKCTNNEKLKYEYVFMLNEDTKIIVSEDIDGNMIDNYPKKETPKNEEKNEAVESENVLPKAEHAAEAIPIIEKE